MYPNKRTDAATERAVLASLGRGLSNVAAGKEFGLNEATVRRIKARAKLTTTAPPVVVYEDKKQSTFYWRDAIPVMRSMQALVKSAKRDQLRATVTAGDGKSAIGVMILADTHIGAIGTDYQLFVELTDMVLQTPNLYVVLVGDLVEWSIRLRSVAEQCAQIMPIELQEQFMDQWLAEIAPKVIAAGWDNHETARSQQLSGFSVMKSLQSKLFPYFDGIGHLTLKVGTQSYPIAMSHKFKGATGNDSTRGCRLYMQKEPEIECAFQAHAHVPKVEKYVVGDTPKGAMCCGTLNVDSDYVQRGWTLRTSDAFPVMLFHHKTHMFSPLFNVDEFLAVMGASCA